MKLRYVRAFIVLLAGLITLLINMKTGRPVTSSLFIVLIVLVVFYVIGTLAVEILQKSMDETIQKDDSQDEEEVSAEEPDEEEDVFSFDEEEVD